LMLPPRYASTMARCLKCGRYIPLAVLVSYVVDAVARCGGCASARMVAESLASEEGAEHRFEQASDTRLLRGILRGLVSAGMFVRGRDASTGAVLFCLKESPAAGGLAAQSTGTGDGGFNVGGWWFGLSVEGLLEPDERVLLEVRESRWRAGGRVLFPERVVATDRRLIIVEPLGLGRCDFEVVWYTSISGVRLRKGILSCEVEVEAMGLTQADAARRKWGEAGGGRQTHRGAGRVAWGEAA
jgi:hypothetical protein